jgi:4-methylaminobutanoate oxidase (formaldehyde-forming)
VIGVMGQGARALLAGVSGMKWQDFPFSTSQEGLVHGQTVRATRLSFAGELGWELSVSVAQAVPVFEALTRAGAQPLGHYALEGCRVEKGFKHWGHDLGPEVTPLEAGLGFAIDWSKEFTGKASLEAQKAEGPTRRVCLFQVEGQPLLLHDEPIREADQVVGLTTSGARGPRTGLDLCFGMIDVAPGETLSATSQRQFEVEVAGRFYPAQVLLRPPYDPDGERMRQ